jgi:Fanconi anemia group M protein
MPTIIIDHRERQSGIIKELIKKNVNIKEKQLISADFVIQTKDFNENIVSVGIERKNQADFINSIIDKRIIKQLISLKENFDVPILILEGSENIYSLRNFHPNAIRGMLASIAIDIQIPILHTKNYRDTAALLKIIANRLEKPRRSISLLKKKKPLSLNQQQEYIIESLPGIGPNLAKSILKEFKTIKKAITSSYEDLQRINKIGPKKSKKIHEVLNKKYKK